MIKNTPLLLSCLLFLACAVFSASAAIARSGPRQVSLAGNPSTLRRGETFQVSWSGYDEYDYVQPFIICKGGMQPLDCIPTAQNATRGSTAVPAGFSPVPSLGCKLRLFGATTDEYQGGCVWQGEAWADSSTGFTVIAA